MSRLNKPIAVFRHSPLEGPGYFATFLDRHSIPWELIRIDEGAAVPNSVAGFAGLCFMGGPMSVNDELPWIRQVLELIRTAAARDVPVIGHCLGGQLISKALGGRVTRNPTKEIGWGAVTPVRDTPVAAEWLGDIDVFEAFHWHGETFSIPHGATRILASAHCANQAYALGPHLGMQCHVEMTEDMIRQWSRQWADEYAAPGPAVQTPEQMMEHAAARIAAMRVVADHLYAHWIGGLKH
ncbi:MAG: type 1 glutamine amidotransferase [Rhodocyclaceae bacterium]|jgi:GMP synthase-like glutamine amidotransferase|nr:type 1 glutamine amidotransferase [Rhodocyclaceae bacterium]